MELKTYLTLDATDLAELIKQKEVPVAELMELSFQQLEKVNPEVNAVVHSRKEQVLNEARQVNPDDAPFAGVPMLLKNISQAVKGEPIDRKSVV